MTVRQPIKSIGVYHWDTVNDGDDETTLLYETDDYDDAQLWVSNNYGGKIRRDGADRIQIVTFPQGQIMETYTVKLTPADRSALR